MIDKFTTRDIFQVAEGDKRVKSDAIDSVKIPLFNQTPSAGVKIKALIDKIVAWVKTKFTTADTKAFLTALGESITANENKISKLKPGDDALVITFNVPKTSERFDRLFITMTIEKDAYGFQLKHNGKLVAEDLEKAELLELKNSVDMMPKSAIKEIRELVNEVKAADTKNKVELTAAKTGFKNDMEYIISSQATKLQAKYDLTAEETQSMTNGLIAFADFGYVFSNTSIVKDKDGKKHAPGKIKFDSSKVTFDEGEVTLKDEVQIETLSRELAESNSHKQKEMLDAILPILSEETKTKIRNIMREKFIRKVTSDLMNKKEPTDSINILRAEINLKLQPTVESYLDRNFGFFFPNELKYQVFDRLIQQDDGLSVEQFTALSQEDKQLKRNNMERNARTEPEMRRRRNEAVLQMNGLGEALRVVRADQEMTLDQLERLGFEIRGGAEVRGNNLILAWDKYRATNLEGNFYEFLISAIPPLNIEEAGQDQICRTCAKRAIAFDDAVDQIVIDFIPDLLPAIIANAANYREAPVLEEPIL